MAETIVPREHHETWLRTSQDIDDCHKLSGEMFNHSQAFDYGSQAWIPIDHVHVSYTFTDKLKVTVLHCAGNLASCQPYLTPR